MPEDEKVVSPPGDAATLEQLQVYARELRQLFEEERRLRQDLDEERNALERKVKELTALNNLFQTYLREREYLKEALLTLLKGVNSLEQLVGETEGGLQEKGYLPAEGESKDG